MHLSRCYQSSGTLTCLTCHNPRVHNSAPADERTLTGLSLLIQSNAIRSALLPYTIEGPFGALLDAAEDRLELSDVHCFETETLMGQPGAVPPVLSYLFHRLEERFDGSPTSSLER